MEGEHANSFSSEQIVWRLYKHEDTNEQSTTKTNNKFKKFTFPISYDCRSLGVETHRASQYTVSNVSN